MSSRNGKVTRMQLYWISQQILLIRVQNLSSRCLPPPYFSFSNLHCYYIYTSHNERYSLRKLKYKYHHCRSSATFQNGLLQNYELEIGVIFVRSDGVVYYLNTLNKGFSIKTIIFTLSEFRN